MAFCWHRLARGVAFGFGSSAFALASFALGAGSRLVLVLAVPCGSGIVCPTCWFAPGPGFGRSRLVFDCLFPFAPGDGLRTPPCLWRWIIRSACAAVSFHFCLDSADRVGRPSHDLASKWASWPVSMPWVNSAPRIPPLKRGRLGGALESVDMKGPNSRPRSRPGALNGAHRK